LVEASPLVAESVQARIISDIEGAREKKHKAKFMKMKEEMSEKEQYAVTLASEKGSSSWLNSLPLEKYGFNLTKQEFRDGL